MRLYRTGEESISAARNWVRRDEVELGERDGVTVAEHQEIVKLRRKVRRLEEEKLILQKAAVAVA